MKAKDMYKNGVLTTDGLKIFHTGSKRDLDDEAIIINHLLAAARYARVNYVFVNKDTFSPELINILKENGFSILTNYDKKSRIKISWDFNNRNEGIIYYNN